MTDENKCSCSTTALSTELKQAKHLLWLGGIVVIITAISLWLAPYFFVEDTSAVTRYMILKIPPMIIDIWVLIGSLVLFDMLTPADSLECINKDPLSTSILYSALLIGVSIAIAFG